MDDPYELARQEEEAEFWNTLPDQLHRDAVKSYLGAYGDAIDERAGRLAGMSRQLLDGDFFGPSLVTSATRIELMVRYFCIRPMIEGAFLTELWANVLSDMVISRRGVDDRKLLVKILGIWKLDLEAVNLPTARLPLWETINKRIFLQRNRYVHLGDDVTRDDATIAIECGDVFRSEIVAWIAQQLGFTLEETNQWARIARKQHSPNYLIGMQRYDPRSPFL